MGINSEPKTWTIAEFECGKFAELLSENPGSKKIYFTECRRKDLPAGLPCNTGNRTVRPEVNHTGVSDPDTLLIWLPDKKLTGGYISAPLKGLLTNSLNNNTLEVSRDEVDNFIRQINETGKITIYGSYEPDFNLVLNFTGSSGPKIPDEKLNWHTGSALLANSLSVKRKNEMNPIPERKGKLLLVKEPESPEQLLSLLKEEDSLIRLLASEKVIEHYSYFSDDEKIEEILSLCKESEPSVRKNLDQVLLRLIGHLGNSGNIRRLALIAEKADYEISEIAAMKIYKTSFRQENEDILISLLNLDNRKASWWVASQLVNNLSIKGLKAILRNPDNFNTYYWNSLVESMSSFCPKEASEAIGALLEEEGYRDDNQGKSLKYLSYLGKIGHPEGYRYAKKYFISVDFSREESMTVYGAMLKTRPEYDTSADKLIYGTLASKSAPESEITAILNCFAGSDEKPEMEKIYPFLKSENINILKSAIHVVGEHGNNEDVGRIADIIGHESEEIRYTALYGLHKLYYNNYRDFSFNPAAAEEGVDRIETAFNNYSDEIGGAALDLAVSRDNLIRSNSEEILGGWQAQFLIDYCLRTPKSCRDNNVAASILSGMSFKSGFNHDLSMNSDGHDFFREGPEVGLIYDDLMDINRGYFQKCMWRSTFSRDPVMRSHVVSVIGNLNNPMKEVMLDQMLRREPADNVKELIRHKLSQIRRVKDRRRLNSVNRKDNCKFNLPAGVSRRASEPGLNRSTVNII